jgi:hypothetical protein
MPFALCSMLISPQPQRSLSPMLPKWPNIMNASALPPRKRIALSSFIRKMLKQNIVSIPGPDLDWVN